MKTLIYVVNKLPTWW